jgi:hypothetical protein
MRTRDPPQGRDPRPDLTPALERLLAAMVAHSHDLRPALNAAVDDVVVVFLSAHGESSASVRALSGSSKSVVIGGRARSIELGLRPPFFLDGDAPARLCTLCHELLHLDGTGLREENRHAHKSHDELEAEARVLSKALLGRLDAKDVLCLAHDGEVLVRAWRHRPTEQTQKRSFSDDDVYCQPVRMVTCRDLQTDLNHFWVVGMA